MFNIENFNGNIYQNEKLANYTTYKIGGAAKFFATVNDVESLKNLIKISSDNDIQHFIIGGGSNLLISDKGYNGLIIKLDDSFKEINLDVKNNLYECGAAVSLAKILNEYLSNSHQNAQFLAGIPGTLGGAVKMNAGRKTCWISSIIENVKIMDAQGNIYSKSVDEIKWRYRHSSIANDEIVLSANLKFEPCANVDSLKSEIENLNLCRKANQPTEKPSCGSVFKNPENLSAGKLIEDCGLKGKILGGAQISDKHANFIINKNNAKAQDVVELINLIQKTVFEKFNVKLIPEVKFLGFDKNCSLF